MNYSKKQPADVKRGLVFEHVTFYPESWKGKELKEFLEHEAHHGLTEAQLKEAWGLILTANKAKKEDVK